MLDYGKRKGVDCDFIVFDYLGYGLFDFCRYIKCKEEERLLSKRRLANYKQ